MKTDRLRPAVVALTAVALTAVLAGCREGGATSGAHVSPRASVTAASGGTPSAKPDVVPSTGVTATSSSDAAGGGTPAGKPKAEPAASATGGASPSAGCVSEPPDPDHVDPDEFALYRVEELDGSAGKVNLVIQHGAWGCPGTDGDGVPFVVTGEDSRWALDQAAYVTATNPVTDSSENRRIGVQELIDWIKAHPDSGLVFKYQTGDDGAVHRLDQVYAP